MTKPMTKPSTASDVDRYLSAGKAKNMPAIDSAAVAIASELQAAGTALKKSIKHLMEAGRMLSEKRQELPGDKEFGEWCEHYLPAVSRQRLYEIRRVWETYGDDTRAEEWNWSVLSRATALDDHVREELLGRTKPPTEKEVKGLASAATGRPDIEKPATPSVGKHIITGQSVAYDEIDREREAREALERSAAAGAAYREAAAAGAGTVRPPCPGVEGTDHGQYSWDEEEENWVRHIHHDGIDPQKVPAPPEIPARAWMERYAHTCSIEKLEMLFEKVKRLEDPDRGGDPKIAAAVGHYLATSF